jgi:hypothetical protein
MATDIRPSRRDDPPSGLTWAQVAWMALITLSSLGSAYIAYLNNRAVSATKDHVEEVDDRVKDARKTQEYHEKQLDSIGAKVDKAAELKKDETRKGGVFD